MQGSLDMKRARTNTDSNVAAILEHLRARARMLRLSLSAAEHVERKAPPDALHRALLNAGSLFRLISVKVTAKDYLKLVKDGEIKPREGSNGFTIQCFNITHEVWSPRWSSCRGSSARKTCCTPLLPCLKNSGHCICPSTKGLSLTTTDHHIMMQPENHVELWALVKKFLGLILIF